MQPSKSSFLFLLTFSCPSIGCLGRLEGVFARTRFAWTAFRDPCSLVASHPVQHNMHVIHTHEAPDLLTVRCLTLPCTLQVWWRGLGELIWQLKPQCHGILRGQGQKGLEPCGCPFSIALFLLSCHRYSPHFYDLCPCWMPHLHWAHKIRHLPYLRRFLGRKESSPFPSIWFTPPHRPGATQSQPQNVRIQW
jgi:hypothetical protein